MRKNVLRLHYIVILGKILVVFDFCFVHLLVCLFTFNWYCFHGGTWTKQFHKLVVNKLFWFPSITFYRRKQMGGSRAFQGFLKYFKCNLFRFRNQINLIRKIPYNKIILFSLSRPITKKCRCSLKQFFYFEEL